MSAPNQGNPKPRKNQPFVPETMEMTEFTLRAVLLGLAMTVVLGAANAYLGLRAGITIAATYPAAVIGMAVLRGWKGTILEENIARTSGTIGEGIAAGAIFTIPAFLIAGVWPTFFPSSLLENHRIDHGRQHPRSAVHFPGAKGHGGGPGTAVSGIRGRRRDSQSWPPRRRSRKISFLEHRNRWRGLSVARLDCLP